MTSSSRSIVRSSSSSSRTKHSFEDYESSRRAFRDDKYMQQVAKIGHNRRILCLGWNCNGKYLASGSTNNYINIYRTDSEKAIKESNPMCNLSHGQSQKCAITALCWHPQKIGLLCTASEDTTVHLWNMDKFNKGQLKPFHIIKTGNPLTGIVWANDNGSLLAISDKDYNITVIDGQKYTEITKKRFGRGSSMKSNSKSMKSEFHCMSFTKDNKCLLITTKEGYIEIYDSLTLTFIHSLQIHNGNCYCIDICNDYIITGGADSMVTIIDIHTLTQIFGLPLFDTPVINAVFNMNGSIIASCSADNFIDISWTKNGKNLQTIRTDASLNCLAWHPKKHLLAYATDAGIGGGGRYIRNYSDGSGGSNGKSNRDLPKNIFIWGAIKAMKNE